MLLINEPTFILIVRKVELGAESKWHGDGIVLCF